MGACVRGCAKKKKGAHAINKPRPCVIIIYIIINLRASAHTRPPVFHVKHPPPPHTHAHTQRERGAREREETKTQYKSVILIYIVWGYII